MRGFEQRLNDFTGRGFRVVAISVDPSDVSRNLCEKQGYTYTFLSDPQAEVIRRYDLLHPAGRPGGADISRPAEFLIDSSRTVRWMNLTEDVRVRARPEQVLNAIDRLGLAKPGP